MGHDQPQAHGRLPGPHAEQRRRPLRVPALPAKGVYYDSTLTVTYWLRDMDDALSY
ncbi:hypothetical protein HDC93_004787 [Streptomyces sp. AK010]|nr:hypothetical protein [Streptomyces sp. AK010]